MDKVNIFHQMAQYDFSTPINVTMIFEEDNDEVSYNINVLKEQNQNNSQQGDKEIINSLEELNTKTQAVPTSNITMSIDLTAEKSQCEGYSSIAKETTQVNSPLGSKVHVTNIYNREAKENVNGNKNMNNTYPQANSNEELPDYVKHLLQTVSEHLILIMRSYNHCYVNKAINIHAEKRFQKIKAYFFNLSYSIVVSVILPKEKNEVFINKFIDKTVCDASKVFKWKCDRKHVEPLYNEMIAWTKKKKEHLKSLGFSSFNEHSMLDPPSQRDGFTSSEKNTDLNNYANHNNEALYNPENNMCIFSSGEPGQEVSINIAPDTLINNFTNQPNNSTNDNPLKNRQVNRYMNTQQTSTQGHNERGPSYFQQNYHSQRNTLLYKSLAPRPPPIVYPQCNITASNRSNNSIYNANWTQNNTMQNYQSPQRIFSFTARRQQYDSQKEGQTSLPSITSITSQNPAQIGRCCVCDNITVSKCLKCNKFSYCSSLCQELDVGIHQNVCQNQTN